MKMYQNTTRYNTLLTTCPFALLPRALRSGRRSRLLLLIFAITTITIITIITTTVTSTSTSNSTVITTSITILIPPGKVQARTARA